MKVGGRFVEEARALSGKAGFHKFIAEDGSEYGSLEVFWVDATVAPEYQDEDECPPGWYWRACQDGCLPDGEPVGPFGSSVLALADAQEW